MTNLIWIADSFKSRNIVFFILHKPYTFYGNTLTFETHLMGILDIKSSAF